MKTTLRIVALAFVLAAGALVALRQSLPPTLVFRSPGVQSTDPAPDGFTLRGQVTYQGAAVPGARLMAMPLLPVKRDVLITTPPTRQGVTDEAGRFEVTGVPGGPVQLTVLADRLAPASMSVEAGPALSATEIAISMEAGVSMEARVTAEGASVQGARVSVMRMGRNAHGDHRPFRTGTTGEDGRFRLEGLEPEGALRLVILAEGRRPYETTVRVPAELPPDILLESGLQIDGRVTTTDGTPVSEVDVQASQGEGYTAGGRSGATGNVRIGGLIFRSLSLRVLKEGFAPARLDLAAPSSGWTIVLRRTGGVAGRGPAGSWLVIDYGGTSYRRAIGADGSFKWDGLPPGSAEARATDRVGRVLASLEVEIPEGGVADGILLQP